MIHWPEEVFWTVFLNQLLFPRINKIHIEVIAGGQSWLFPASLASLVAHVLGLMHSYPFITAFIDFFFNVNFLKNHNCTVQNLSLVILALAVNIILFFCSLSTDLPKAFS